MRDKLRRGEGRERRGERERERERERNQGEKVFCSLVFCPKNQGADKSHDLVLAIVHSNICPINFQW